MVKRLFLGLCTRQCPQPQIAQATASNTLREVRLPSQGQNMGSCQQTEDAAPMEQQSFIDSRGAPPMLQAIQEFDPVAEANQFEQGAAPAQLVHVFTLKVTQLNA